MQEKIKNMFRGLFVESGYHVQGRFALYDGSTERDEFLERHAYLAGLRVRQGKMLARYKKILLACAEEFGCLPSQLLEQSRKRNVADARKAVCWLLRCREPLGLSLKDVAILTGRTHGNVYVACERVEKEWPFDKELTQHLNNIKTKLYGEEQGQQPPVVA